eukprot:CAMPEP_0118878870 /NCGR_PEP_ID=MMETSP1163-20130328/18740_1 /TAXON_ID=124430 /ORGANISM="Phaeomonas parva, Strain CCMP2877" /LENGTH=102 /DNA_ID=CAMNT_0006814831 /DNA_START=59 /DNA_END=364 /DNA_ORIENTATION=+
MADCAPPCVEEGEKPVAYQNRTIEDIYARWDSIVSPELYPKLRGMVRILHADPPPTERDYQKSLQKLRKQYKCVPRKAQLLHVYQRLVTAGELSPLRTLRDA